MRIGQFTDSFLPIVDGVGRVLESYADVLGGMGHAVTVFAPGARMGDVSRRPFRVVTYRTVRMPKLPYRVGLPRLDVRFDRRLNHSRLDIVHVHSPFMVGRAGLRYARLHGVPVVGTFHSKFYDDFKQALKLESLARFGVRQVADFYEQCDEVWAVAETSAHTLYSYGYRGRISVMPNGVSLRVLDDSVLPELRARYGLMPDIPLLLFVGQMNHKKNVLRILQAARLLSAEGIPYKLLLCGKGPHAAEIAGYVRQMGLSSRVELTGHIASMRELDGLYALSRLFVFPSLYDCAPMVLREAAAMGTPTVVIAGSNAAECVQSGINGFTCEDTPESLREAMKAAILNETAAALLGEEAKRTIAVPWETLMQKVVGRYKALLEREGVRCRTV
ncbi:MAG: glycosyltransferase [Clostridia bacterium]|nr:glycosyltransferase [Clostridia bacterium]